VDDKRLIHKFITDMYIQVKYVEQMLWNFWDSTGFMWSIGYNRQLLI